MSTVEFIMPDIGEGLSEAEIVKWCIAEGDSVIRDQTVVEVETDKSIVGIPAPADAVIEKCLVPEGDMVQIGAALFRFVPKDTAAPKSVAAVAVSPQPPASIPAGASDVPATITRVRVLASPATRKLALDRGIDLGDVVGSGPGGRVTKDDVLGHRTESGTERPAHVTPPQPTTTQPSDRGVALRGLRRQIARTMTESWQTVPHITDFREVDATGLTQTRDALRRHLSGDVKLTFLPILVKAVTVALRRNPVFNASVDMAAEEITYHGRINVGIATATPDGLIVPVLKDADTLPISEISRQIDWLSTRARERSSKPDELNDGTFTISNFGSFGGWLATPIIRPPEAAIAGFGRIREQVVAVDGQPVVRSILPVCVSADHRLIDGDAMGAFLSTLSELLTEPVLMIEGA